jgi:cytochrome c oxidase subunit IV
MAAHIGSLKVYFGVFMVLMIGTAVTIYAAFLDLGMANAPIALFIATVKAIFVVLFFMHVKDSDRLTKITVTAGIFWLGILLSLTMTDFLSRTWY